MFAKWFRLLKCALIAGLGGGLAKMAVDNFVLKDTPEDSTGFVLKSDGIGLDDAVVALGVGLGAVLALKLTGCM